MTRIFSFSSYLYLLASFFLLAILGLFLWSKQGNDHPGAIALPQNNAFYRNFDDRLIVEIQDRDIFYHNIGNSIDYVKNADIVILGHSMVLFGLRDDLIKDFEKKHGIKIYNLGSAGDASGEFLRRIIKRWKIRPKLWIINADDFGGNFFNVALNDYGLSGQSSAISVVKYSRPVGYTHVVGRNFRWRIEDFISENLPKKMSKSLFKNSRGVMVWRNVKDGNWFLDHYPAYLSDKNPLITVTRDQNCHTTDDEIAKAKKYLASIGGAPAILMLVPYHKFCPQRVKELADALGEEYIVPPTADYTAVDSGGHLDKKGAIAFTKFFLSNLEQTAAFKQIAPH